jgi:hypothetical protein
MTDSRIQKLVAAGLFLSALGVGGGMAQAESADAVTMKPVRVSLFKNGYGFITMRGKTGEGAAMELKNLPVPAFGTFWISASHPAKITCLVSSQKTEKRLVRGASMVDVANANPGKQIRIVTESGVVEGMVVGLKKDEETAPNPNLIGGRDEDHDQGESYLVVKTTAGTLVVLSQDRIKQIEFSSLNALLPCVTSRLLASNWPWRNRFPAPF